ncbi:9057_t:CDS:10 [Entrophospora sp. SA101]|nr:9057_t:CDS:10 [Entrophospora sp. SA101]
MALHYFLIFGLFVVEIAAFLVLIIPFPSRFRRNILLWISKSTLVNATYGTYKIQKEIVDRSDQRLASVHAAKKFYNQRQLESAKREIGIQNESGEKGKNLKKENQDLKKELEEQKLKSQETENLLKQIELQKSEYLKLLDKKTNTVQQMTYIDYLDPQFRSHLMTKKCLMEILTKYNIPCKPSMKKSEIVEIFERNKKRLQSLTFDNETGHSTDQESNNSDDNNEVDNGNESDTTVVSYNEIPSKITGSYIINGTTTIIQEQHTTITQRQPATTTQRQPSTIQEQLATITQDRLSSLSSNNANEPPPPNIVDEPSSNNADESPPSNIVDESPSNNVNESPSINDIERSPSLRVIYGNTSHELHYNLPRYCGAGTKFNSNDYFRRTNRRLNLKVYNESEWIQKKNILKSIVLIIIMALLFCHRVKNSTGYCHNGDSNLICTPCPDSSKCIGGRIVSCDDGYKLSKSIFSLYDMTSTYCKAEMSAKEKTAFYSETLKKAATTQSQNNMVCGNGVKNTMLLHNLKSRIRDQMYEDSDEIFENFIRHGLEALKNDHDLIIREYGIK